MTGSNQTTTTKYLILDTNIFSRFTGESDISKNILKYLENLLSNSLGWESAISAFTLFEAINEINYKEEQRIADTLNKFNWYELARETLIISGHLGCLYREYFNDIGCSDKTPEHGDKIIAGTSMQYGMPVCTMNQRDYPAPFFKEILREEIISQGAKNKGPCLTVIYIMEPQVALFEKYFKKWCGENSEKKSK